MSPQEAVEFVRAWRDDDEELRIPMNAWGHALAEAIDILLKQVPTITINHDRVPPRVRGEWVGEGLARGHRRGILLFVDIDGRVIDGELSTKIPHHEVVEVLAGSRIHATLSDTFRGNTRGQGS